MSYDFMSKICNPGHSRLLFSISIKKKEGNKHELRCTSNQWLQLQILDSANLQSDNCWFIKVNTKVNKVAPIVSWDRKRCIREVPESFANLQKCQSVCPQLGRQRHWQRALDNEAVLTGHWRVSFLEGCFCACTRGSERPVKSMRDHRRVSHTCFINVAIRTRSLIVITKLCTITIGIIRCDVNRFEFSG